MYMKVKVFPKSRVCAIDAYPSFEASLSKAIQFTKKHDIAINSADGKRLILGFFLDEIAKHINDTTSLFPKVLFMSTKSANSKMKSFIHKHVVKILERLPVHYCGIYEQTSPDLEMAALSSLTQTKSNKNFNRAVNKLRIKNSQHFSTL
jgi:hypothetical protein